MGWSILWHPEDVPKEGPSGFAYALREGRGVASFVKVFSADITFWPVYIQYSLQMLPVAGVYFLDYCFRCCPAA